MSLTVFFGTIHKSDCTIFVNFYLYLQYFLSKNFQFQQKKRISNKLMCKKKKGKQVIYLFILSMVKWVHIKISRSILS